MEIIRKILKWLVNNFIGIIAFFISGSEVTAIILKAIQQTAFTTLEIVLLVLTLTESIILIIFVLWRRLSYKSTHYPWGKIKPSYIIESQEINYIITENNFLEFSYLRKIKCLSDKLNNIPGKYIWTGKRDANLPQDQTGYSFHEVRQKGIWNFYEIRFNDCLLRNHTKEVLSKFNPIPDCTSASPFVSATTEEPTKKIIFKIVLGNYVEGDTVTLEEYRSTEGFYPLSSCSIPISPGGIINYTIKNPKRFRFYEISWTWKK